MERTKERAIAVVDRAARLNKPGIFDRRLFDPQMRTPGYRPAPFSLYRMPADALREVGEMDVPLKKVRTEQPSVSVAKVKAKIGADGAPTKMVRHQGLYWTMDGNHRTTGARAEGKDVIRSKVFEIAPGVKPPLLSPRLLRTASEVGKGALGPVMVGALAKTAYDNRKASGGTDAEAMGDAAVTGARTAATGLAIGSVARAAAAVPALRTAASVAMRSVLPLSIAGHAIGYGAAALARGEGIGGAAKAAAWGAVNGVVPVDIIREAIDPHAGHGVGHDSAFDKANRNFEASQHSPGRQDGRRGWSDAARISAAKSRGAKNLPYGGQPRS